jgi:mRNA-degrading endonuclease RelE of RelBE toxin-antitoxin system
MKRMITIIEFPSFLSQVGVTISSSERDELIEFLAKNPDAGDEIMGTGGVRKLRWRGKGKGKRGGLRIIYYFYNETAPVFLLTVYGKGVQENLTPEQKKKMTSLAKMLKQEFKAARKNHHE